MRIATMTTQFRNRRDSSDLIGYVESMRRCKESGFTVLDLNMCAMLNYETELNGDDWKYNLDTICNEASRLGVEFVQSHPPYRPMTALHFKTKEQDANFAKLTKRALYATSAVGAKWAVVHPVTESENAEFNLSANLKANHEAFDEAMDYADKHNVGLAFENMCDKNNKRRFGATADELLEIVNSFKGANIGVCWDTGHANRVYHNQIPPIKKLGKYIKALHIDDNLGSDDLHLVPFLGTVPWERVMKALKEIGYSGDLVYELKLNDNMPDALKRLSSKYSYQIGEYLLSLAK